MDPTIEPSRNQLESAVQTQFRLAIGRKADAHEVERFLSLYEKCAKDGDHPAAVKTMLQAVLLRADAMYRFRTWCNGKRRFQSEDAAAVGIGPRLELGPSGTVEKAASCRLLKKVNSPPRKRSPLICNVSWMILRSRSRDYCAVFPEYFEYHPRPGCVLRQTDRQDQTRTQVLVSDTDRLVLYILEQDKTSCVNCSPRGSRL